MSISYYPLYLLTAIAPSWKRAALNGIVEEVTQGAGGIGTLLRAGFPKDTDIKIYGYLLSNRELLFAKEIQITLLEENYRNNKITIEKEIQSKSAEWMQDPSLYKICLGDHLVFVVQAVACYNRCSRVLWETPHRVIERHYLGVSAANPFPSGGGGMQRNVETIHKQLCNDLSRHGIPTDQIPTLEDLQAIQERVERKMRLS